MKDTELLSLRKSPSQKLRDERLLSLDGLGCLEKRAVQRGLELAAKQHKSMISESQSESESAGEDGEFSREITGFGLDCESKKGLRSPLMPSRPADSHRSRSASPRFKAISIGTIVTAVFARSGRRPKSRPDSRSPTQMTPTPPLGKGSHIRT